MKEIAVISGKGGTGKTSLVASFASLAKKAVLADCDVDAANLHLVLEPQILEHKDFYGGKIASVMQEDCTSCHLCYELCRFDAVTEQSQSEKSAANEYFIDPFACEGCGVCEYFCLDKAISFEEDKCGDLFISETRFGMMVHAKLGIAKENSGKLVALVREHAQLIAEKQSADHIIIDGPPGIGCSVISSITGSNIVVIVTEPTVSGVSDLQRIEKLAKHFDIPAVVCINKYDINTLITEEITNYCKKNQIGVLGTIPYDIAFTKAQIQGINIIEYAAGDLSNRIISIWENLCQKKIKKAI